jgi:hypothetical protein
MTGKRASKLLAAISTGSNVVSEDPGGLTIKTAAAFADVPETTIRHWLKTVDELKAPNAVMIWQPEGTDVQIPKISRLAMTAYLERKAQRGSGRTSRRGTRFYRISVLNTQRDAVAAVLEPFGIELQLAFKGTKAKQENDAQKPVAADLFTLPVEETQEVPA